MPNSFMLMKGDVPLLISMPHNGQDIPDDITKTMTDEALKIRDTDWFKDKLYDFAALKGAYIIKPKYSRYVIDLNRDPNDENLYPGANSTELCPTTAFNLSALYVQDAKPNKAEIARRVALYWQPYHQAIQQTLAEMKQQFGGAVLLDAHSILSHVPRFFEGRLPDFNFGTADGKTCNEQLLAEVEAINFSPYTRVTNHRFKGGYITRAYGDPANNIHSIQLELSQITYMDEHSLTYNERLAEQVKPKLSTLVDTLISFGKNSFNNE